MLLLALAVLLASCGGTGGGEAQRSPHSDKDGPGNGHIQGMDHGPGSTVSGMLMKDGKYSDRRFIDAMVPHHDGAVEMARVALKNAEHPEMERLAENIIGSQTAEIKELESIKQEEFGTSKFPMRMSMGMMMDPQSLADEKPFDRAFIDNMIPHHRSAIEMAEVARHESKNPQIRDLASNIVNTQKREISQMKAWREQWYPQN